MLIDSTHNIVNLLKSIKFKTKSRSGRVCFTLRQAADSFHRCCRVLVSSLLTRHKRSSTHFHRFHQYIQQERRLSGYHCSVVIHLSQVKRQIVIASRFHAALLTIYLTTPQTNSEIQVYVLLFIFLLLARTAHSDRLPKNAQHCIVGVLLRATGVEMKNKPNSPTKRKCLRSSEAGNFSSTSTPVTSAVY